MSVGAPILLAARQISRRTSSRALVAQATMWKASAHRVAFGHRSPNTVAIHSAASAETSFTSWDRPSPSRSKNCSRVALSRPGAAHTRCPVSWSTTTVRYLCCLLYTSDAADEEDSVDLGGRRIIKKKK